MNWHLSFACGGVFDAKTHAEHCEVWRGVGIQFKHQVFEFNNKDWIYLSFVCSFDWPIFVVNMLTSNLDYEIYGVYSEKSFFFWEKSGTRTFICFRLFIASIWMSFQCNRWISRAKPKHIHSFFNCISLCNTNVNIRFRHSLHHQVESSIFPTDRRWRNSVE